MVYSKSKKATPTAERRRRVRGWNETEQKAEAQD